MSTSRARRESDLVAYYDEEVSARAARDIPKPRLEHRAAYIEMLRSENRQRVLEIGCGPGREAQAFMTAGLTYAGVDLAPASVEACRAQGLEVQAGSVLALPFTDGEFDAAWTMSTLLHVANVDIDAALAEIVRVLRPGSPVAIGLWGATTDSEERLLDGTKYGPPRFFSIRTDETMYEALSRHGTIVESDSWPGARDWHYQWAVLRV
ncbi:MAG: class I SAM-dependent methyltransferase [Actinomycetia bacterium]|nr:class I SAM-dependent methyltransferase [Actinomycetes bacterium]